MSISENLSRIRKTLPEDVALVAVSKTRSNEEILEAYAAGQRIFGENKVQEMAEKHQSLPKDIAWHMIGHVQTNKVRIMAPFVSLIHSVDSLKLLKEIDREAAKNNRVIDCLLQLHIATEDTKFGMDERELEMLLASPEFSSFKNIKVIGFMGMATFTDKKEVVSEEFKFLRSLFNRIARTQDLEMKVLSMGMSDDYMIAIENGSNMVRIGSNIFGSR